MDRVPLRQRELQAALTGAGYDVLVPGTRFDGPSSVLLSKKFPRPRSMAQLHSAKLHRSGTQLSRLRLTWSGRLAVEPFLIDFRPDFALVLGGIFARLPTKTYRQVSRRMRKSSHGEALRIYHSSRSSFSSFVICLPPLTWAHPVMPGRTIKRMVGSAGWSWGSRGRGPISDISPTRTF